VSHALRVLLVDDQPDVRESVANMLVALGHEVAVAAGGEQALGLARESTFDVVITDLGMPGLNGLDVARGIRTISPGTPVVLLTGWGLASGDRMHNDVDLVAGKPLTLDTLSDILARATRPPASDTSS
jgi:CheY-like chemotaxis protein